MWFFFWPFKLVGFLIQVALLGVLLASFVLTITGFFGEKGWLWDLTSHFRLVWAVIQLVALLVLLAGRRRFLAFLTTVFLALNLWQIAPFFLPQTPPAEADIAARVRLLQMNVWEQNEDYGQVVDYIREIDPDFFALQECGPPCNDYFRESGIRKIYRHRIYVPDNRIALYGKRSLRHWVLTEDVGRSAIIVATAMVANRPVRLIVIHSDRPSGAMREYQVRLFQKLARFIREMEEPIILMGDFNSTPWSVHFRRLLAGTGLHNTQYGFGVYPTYPVFWKRQLWSPIPVIPIDHVFVSDDFVTLERQNGRHIGSDHLPVVVELGLLKSARS